MQKLGGVGHVNGALQKLAVTAGITKPVSMVTSESVSTEDLSASMLKDPDMQGMDPEVAKAAAAFCMKYLNKQAVTVQPQRFNISGEPSSEHGDRKGPADGQASAAAQDVEEKSDEDMTGDELEAHHATQDQRKEKRTVPKKTKTMTNTGALVAKKAT